ncbi:peptidoglycan-binding protein [Frisingicoccus sp.]|uniref:peptidoglycan-binding protein n=1 Tax=Frisingicoccus sp. TaxID=1918627 RepID=UPI002A835022|nr:peptidoglycan-binding protein [Frisingicoccus sp.]MDY4833551.1 peptidoglycan-binding protein [Frisingicoccus sp.]MDY4923545.1 peptidoglycan-binding protein [Frisingicoccus sp.]
MPDMNSFIDKGQLQISAVSAEGNVPIDDATIEISPTGEPENVIEQLTTDSSGNSETIDLDAPPVEYSLSPGDNQPYSEYNLKITAPGYDEVLISGIQILSGQLGLSNIRMTPTVRETAPYNPLVIGAHTLWKLYPPKIAEPEIKDIAETGEIVLSRVVVPETIIVHAGPPTDASAPNYYVPYRDYIKNVASSEIYATWPESTIIANVLAIMSFTLNRVYTEWYRNKGFDFTITSSTAYDHFFVYGRNIYESISRVVDTIFANYLSRPNVRQPILTQYCDGKRVSCPNWMSQWGSMYLGDQGYTPIEIIRNYYGSDMYINSAELISGIPASWPGTDLTVGSTGSKVRQMQEQLDRISQTYPALPSVTPDGIYGESTRQAVEAFQRVFNLPVTGVVDYPTWYKISEIYVAVTRIAELT